MKPKFILDLWRTMVSLAFLLAISGIAAAQLPNCTNGSIMYAIFNNTSSTTADSSEIRPVDVTTGAVGNLVGGKRYLISKTSSGDTYYGSAGMGVDAITNRFYVITQMSSGSNFPKDIITIDPVTTTMTVIGTTQNSGPNSLGGFHFVKLAVSPNGYGYAIGVHRDESTNASTYNPLIRFTTCGAVASNNCSTIQLLGYLPSTGVMTKQKLFNGDIAFDIFGNLYFLTAAFEQVAGASRYTDARLFRINATDIPAAAGNGTIPMSFVADYDQLDSTAINGIGLDGYGNMYFTTRRYAGGSQPTGPFATELYRSSAMGLAVNIPGFGPIPTNFSSSDLASCYFPMTILESTKLQLGYKYETGNVNLKWEVTNNSKVSHYEIQRSSDGSNFTTISTTTASGQSSANYAYGDAQNGFEKNKFYRIRAYLKSGMRLYSNVVNVVFNAKFNLVSNIKPNPFVNHIEAQVWMKASGSVNVRIMDQNGRVVVSTQFAGKAGENKISVDRLGNLSKGVYIVELGVQDEVIREKVIKQ